MSLDKLNNLNIHVVPRCATCGMTDAFECNEDSSYIKCTNCGREYFGGKDELLEYNQDAIDEAKEKLKALAAPILQQELLKRLNKR